MYGTLCLGTMHGDSMPQVYVWRPIPRDYICMETYVSELCMETYVSEHFVMTPSLCDSLP
ncbi:hypothetical protein DPMN_075271 [Dreissena polymorpha]|uniref:Uncharacterized protein n=1 Tax=Dreissena polymorpha TaxID=45954 RepID=A0A9D3YHT5_DREPO|nr:hypothetical protein DPMN_075271 [Dreissena polymorpha]